MEWSTTLTVLMLVGACKKAQRWILSTGSVSPNKWHQANLKSSYFWFHIFSHMISYVFVFIPLSFRKSHGDLHVERSILIQQPTGATCCAVDLVRQKRQEAAELIRTLMTQRNTPEKPVEVSLLMSFLGDFSVWTYLWQKEIHPKYIVGSNHELIAVNRRIVEP